MLPKEILKKVRKIQLKTAKLSDEAMTGHYASAFKGMGMEFSEVREYVAGDDVRSIDWNVTARSGVPFIKRYMEERELTVVLMVDLSASQRFGSVNRLKSELAAEISALLAFLAIKNNDKVGLLIFSDTCERYIPPQKGRGHVLRVIREILAYQPSGAGTRIDGALSFINKVLKHRSVVFVISDFLDDDFEKTLKNSAKRHDVIGIRLSDPRESVLPELGLIEFEDSETGRRVLVDSSAPEVRSLFQERIRRHDEAVTRLFRKNRIDLIEIKTSQPYLEPLQRFFIQRERRFH
jgi:uncharacterized protein (DUF58 family)